MSRLEPMLAGRALGEVKGVCPCEDRTCAGAHALGETRRGGGRVLLLVLVLTFHPDCLILQPHLVDPRGAPLAREHHHPVDPSSQRIILKNVRFFNGRF